MSCRMMEEMLETMSYYFAFCQMLGEAWGMVANHSYPHTAKD
jgi:hypothetical protein